MCLLEEDSLSRLLCSSAPGTRDHRGVWGGVYRQDLGRRMLLSLPRLEREAQVRKEALLCDR